MSRAFASATELMTWETRRLRRISHASARTEEEMMPVTVRMWPLAIAGMVATSALTYAVVRPHRVAAAAASTTSTDTVAATVNGQPIMMSAVEQQAMEMAGAPALQQMIQFRLIDDEARRKGISVTADDLDRQLQSERAKLAVSASTQSQPGGTPSALEDMLKLHHMTMAQFDVIMTHNIELRKLLIDQVPVFPMYHVRAVMVFVSTPGSDAAGPRHTDAQAHAVIEQAERALKFGKKWDDVVTKYSEDQTTKGRAGDLGIINKADRYDPAFVEAAARLKNGEISAPFKILDGYAIAERVSTGNDHPAAEAKSYHEAEGAYEDYSVGHLVPPYVQRLQSNAKIVDYLSP